MILTGRRVIRTTYDEINETNLIEVLNATLVEHLLNVSEICYLKNYFKGFQPILSRTKKYHDEVNNKVVENHASEIVSFKVGYLLQKPIQYVSRKEKVNDKMMEILNDYMLLENKKAKDEEIAKEQSICGIGHRLTLQNSNFDNSDDEAPFKIRSIDSECAYVVHSSDYEETPLMGVLVDKIKNDLNEDVYRFQVFTKTRFYEVIKDEIVVNLPHSFKKIPLVEYPLNKERIGDFEIVISLLDAINTVQSNRVDGVEQFIQSLLLFKNVDIDDEDFKSLKELGAIKVKDSGEYEADVKFLTQELNQTQVQTLKNDMYSIVLKIVGMPSQADGNTSDSSNNGAVILKNGWQGAEARASATEIIFENSEREFLKIALDIARTMTLRKLDLSIKDFDIKFTRRNYENQYQKAQTLDLMLKNGKIAPRLAFVYSGMFTDPEQAYAESKNMQKSKKQKKKRLLKRSKPMSKVKVTDFNIEMIAQICDILNKGNEVHIKREKDNVVIVKQKRECVSKNPIS